MKKMRTVKSILALLLALTILTAAGPLSAYAEMGTDAAPAQEAAVETAATGEPDSAAAAEDVEGTQAGEAGGTGEDAAAESGEEAADGEESSSEQKENPEMTEDGHIDGERLKLWLENYLAADHWDEPQCSISVCFWYSGSDETWLYNPDEWMYGVNWSKLPVSMYFAEQLAKGELSNDTSINGITLEYALQTVLENSSGPSFSSMLIHLDGNTVSNCAELVPQYANLPEDYYTDQFYQESYYTARIMMEVTKTLYLSGDERFPNVLEYMKASQPWDMFNRDQWVREGLHTSQTHAAFWGNGAGDYLHCTGVIYANNPFVLTVMMKNISDLDIMGGIAHHFCVLAQSMGYRQHEVEKAQKTAEAEALAAQEAAAAEQAAAEEEAAAAADTTPSPISPEGAAEAAAPAPEPAQEEANSPTPRILLMATLLLLLILLIVAAVLLRSRRNRKPRRRAR